MNKKLYILFILIQGLMFFHVSAQKNNLSATPVLFLDRDYCISGDTVWFKVLLSGNKDTLGNVVRVQADSKNGNLIAEVAVKCKKEWASGYLHVPDSLSTGQYFLTAYLNSQRNNPSLKLESQPLLVYNRFEEYVSKIEIAVPATIDKIPEENNSVLNVFTDKEEYRTREKVKVKMEEKPGVKIQNAVVNVSLADPLSREISGKYIVEQSSSNLSIPNFVESDGLLLSGKVSDKSGNLQPGMLVLLSIGIEPPYFDYYFTGENGDFHFYLKNAFGKTKFVLQVISNSEEEYFIHLENNSLVRQEAATEQTKVLNIEQTEFVKTAIESSFADKLFNPVISASSEDFEFQNRFVVPFYGSENQRVIPDEFFDLDDFQEISREILQGAQYRDKNGEISIRLFNSTQNKLFDNEPLRLLNGVPIFDNELLTGLKSTDIAYIDLVKQERIFGDMMMKGILSVVLHDKSNTWLAGQPNTFQFEVNFLQQEKVPGYAVYRNIKETYPDIRQNYFWDLFDVDKNREFEFVLSDRKGKVEITVTGFTQNNEFFKSSKIITVK